MVGTFHTDLAAYTTILSGWRSLGTLMREYMRWPYGRCDQVLVPSEATRRLLVGARGNPQRICVWTRGVDADAFSPSLRSESLRREWGVSDDRPAVLYVGRISREKGLGHLPALQRLLQEAGVPHRFVLAGQGPMLSELQATLTDAVFTGSLNRRDVAVAFASADVFLFPSRTDTAGNVVLEAQASGLPVMVSDEGGPQENMRHGKTGFVISGTQSAAWVYTLGRLLRDKALRTRMATEAREYALTRRWEVALRPLYRSYHDVLVARAAGRQATLEPLGEPIA
jgi:glycosyltransferase involved in cell wall biosynthesis